MTLPGLLVNRNIIKMNYNSCIVCNEILQTKGSLEKTIEHIGNFDS